MLKDIIGPVLLLLLFYSSSAQPENIISTKENLKNCNTKASLYLMRYQSDSAKIYIDTALLLIASDPENLMYQHAGTLNQLGTYYLHTYDYQKAVDSYSAAYELGKKAMEPNDLNFIGIVVNLGGALDFVSNIDAAENQLLYARQLLWALPDFKNIQEYKYCIRDLISVYDHAGKFEEALKTTREYIELIQLQSGKDNREYRYALQMIGINYDKLGQFEMAENFYLQSLTLIERSADSSTMSYPGALINFALLCKNDGRYQQAENLLLKAREILELKLLATAHPWYGNCIYNLALVYLEQEKYEKAYPYVRQSHELDKVQFGENSPEYAGGLDLLADCYANFNQLDTAKTLLLKSLEIKEPLLGHIHPEIANTVSRLANVLSAQKRIEEAEIYYKDYLNITALTEGKESQKYLFGLVQYIKFLNALNPHNLQMDSMAEEALTLNNDLVLQAVKYMSETELYFDIQRHEQYFQALLAMRNQTLNTISEKIYNSILLFKELLLYNSNNVRSKIGSDTMNLQKLELLRSYNWQIASILSLPLTYRDSSRLDQLNSKSNLLEKELTQDVARYGDQIREVQWKEVQSALKNEEIAIEFIQRPKISEEKEIQVEYGALLLRPLDSKPLYVDLFSEQELLNIGGNETNKYSRINEMYSAKSSAAYDLIWKPLVPYLIDCKTLYISVSGLLHRVNLGAMPFSNERIVDDQFHIIQLGSTRELAISASSDFPGNDGVFIGGVTYELDTMVNSIATTDIAGDESIPRNGPGFSESDSTLRGNTWNFLKGSEAELIALEPIVRNASISATFLHGQIATEEKIKELGRSNHRKNSPRIIHISTHGYFFPDPKEEVPSHIISEAGNVIKSSDHPMIRSGLILAGGNYAWKHGHPYKPGMEDGILTAYEISQMDLSNTELVVLSACETGLGDIEGNEGVYGLQRAFKIAGVKNLIMSLWQVPDAATAELMTSFYRHWLEDKMTIRVALYTAQKEMRDQGMEPFEWAGWVIVE